MTPILVEYIIALHSSLNTTAFFSLYCPPCPSTTDTWYPVNLAPLDPPGTSVTLVIGSIPEHCTFQYLPWRSLSHLWHHVLTCTFMSLMYISLLVHFIDQSTFFLLSAVLPHPTYPYPFHLHLNHTNNLHASRQRVLSACCKCVYTELRWPKWGLLGLFNQRDVLKGLVLQRLLDCGSWSSSSISLMRAVEDSYFRSTKGSS
jgi:hypothetical protein